MLAAAGISNTRMDKNKLKAAQSGEYSKGGNLGVKENANAVAHIIRTMKIKREEVRSRHGKSLGSGARRPIIIPK